MSNILKAFINIVNNYKTNITNVRQGNNRANNIGEGLETYIKNVFANTINETNKQTKLVKLETTYSHQGNKNNPPDLILRGGDAIEIKRIESRNSAIALNSSYPKAKLDDDSQMITTDCIGCEEWVEKDMLYAVGYTNESALKSLWLCYCCVLDPQRRIVFFSPPIPPTIKMIKSYVLKQMSGRLVIQKCGHISGFLQRNGRSLAVII
ncbi:MAG: NgoPII family restriction endonuclease [Sulfurospirillum sp.]|nr:NgoPII family restriction endonuclease [Sulfurospirillum sp.]